MWVFSENTTAFTGISNIIPESSWKQRRSSYDGKFNTHTVKVSTDENVFQNHREYSELSRAIKLIESLYQYVIFHQSFRLKIQVVR